MVKKLSLIVILMMIMLTCSYLVLGVVSGTTVTVTELHNCDNINRIEVTGTLDIDDGEYELVGCEKSGNVSEPGTYWSCDCHDDYELQMKVGPATVNNYSFDIQYEYEESSRGGSSGGRSSGHRYVDYDLGSDDVVSDDNQTTNNSDDGNNTATDVVNETIIDNDNATESDSPMPDNNNEYNNTTNQTTNSTSEQPDEDGSRGLSWAYIVAILLGVGIIIIIVLYRKSKSEGDYYE